MKHIKKFNEIFAWGHDLETGLKVGSTYDYIDSSGTTVKAKVIQLQGDNVKAEIASDNGDKKIGYGFITTKSRFLKKK